MLDFKNIVSDEKSHPAASRFENEFPELVDAISNGYLKHDLEPIKCPNCENNTFVNNTKSIDGGHVSEYECVCSKCNLVCGYWAYGNWEI